jgi:hypothetical protein
VHQNRHARISSVFDARQDERIEFANPSTLSTVYCARKGPTAKRPEKSVRHGSTPFGHTRRNASLLRTPSRRRRLYWIRQCRLDMASSVRGAKLSEPCRGESGRARCARARLLGHAQAGRGVSTELRYRLAHTPIGWRRGRDSFETNDVHGLSYSVCLFCQRAVAPA